MIQDKGSPWAGHHYVFIRDTLPHIGLLLFLSFGLMGNRIKGLGIGFYGLGFGLRNNGDLWGKVFFLGFRLGILGIWFHGDFGLEIWEYGFGIFWLDIWHMGITGFWGFGFRDFLA